MTDQVDLLGPRLAQNLVDPRQELLTAHFAGMQRRDLYRNHHRPTLTQRGNDAVPIGIEQ